MGALRERRSHSLKPLTAYLPRNGGLSPACVSVISRLSAVCLPTIFRHCRLLVGLPGLTGKRLWSGYPWDLHLTLKEQPARSAREIGKDLYRERQGFRNPPPYPFVLRFAIDLYFFRLLTGEHYISSACLQAGEKSTRLSSPIKKGGGVAEHTQVYIGEPLPAYGRREVVEIC